MTAIAAIAQYESAMMLAARTLHGILRGKSAFPTVSLLSLVSMRHSPFKLLVLQIGFTCHSFGFSSKFVPFRFPFGHPTPRRLYQIPSNAATAKSVFPRVFGSLQLLMAENKLLHHGILPRSRVMEVTVEISASQSKPQQCRKH